MLVDRRPTRRRPAAATTSSVTISISIIRRAWEPRVHRGPGPLVK